MGRAFMLDWYIFTAAERLEGLAANGSSFLALVSHPPLALRSGGKGVEMFRSSIYIYHFLHYQVKSIN